MPIFSKVIEKIMCDRLTSFLDVNDIIAHNQYGFKKGFSTEHALIDFSTTIYESINSNFKTVAIFLDIKKAFDSVNHKILLHKLEIIGIRGTQFEWFRSYLDNRKQCVKIQNKVSDFNLVHTGVPQGSILGSILFSIFINDLCKLDTTGKIITYADDTVIIYSAANYDSLQNDINADLLKIGDWFNVNDLILNSNKTKYINFTLRNNDNVDLNLIYHSLCTNNLNCNCPLIQKVNTFKYLGLHIDQNLKWKSHVQYLRSKLRIHMHTFYYLRKYVDQKFLKTLYFAWVQSILQYGIVVWGGDYFSNLLPLYKVHNRFLKLLKPTVLDRILPLLHLYIFRLNLYVF